MTSVHRPLSTVHSLLLVGCGKMGGALLERWKQSHASHRYSVIDPGIPQKHDSGIDWYAGLEHLPANYTPNVIVLAVKPQQLSGILPAYRVRFEAANPLYISIAAGKTLSFYANLLGEHAHVVRAMPNTPALVAQGMSVLHASSTLPAAARRTAAELLKAVGKVEWVEEESLMDAVTAISGCGPAYVFLFLEAMISAAVELGVPQPLAAELAAQTVSGSLALAAHSTQGLEQLRHNVASPGGATEAALSVLTHGDALKALMRRAMVAAQKRSQELSSAG